MPTKQTGTQPVEEKSIIAQQFYTQVSESIKLVGDLASRIDERVKMLVENQNDLEERMDKFAELQHQAVHRVTILETKEVSALGDVKEAKIDAKKELDDLRNKIQLLELKCEGLQLRTAHHDTRMNQVFDWVLKFMFMLLGGYLLYKFGWSSAPTP